ncbi:MAG: DNA gyrase subunit A [Magnetococcales bacterium]|nr:DNA gyrase subunit A [Magnetococcales bacterium]
MTDQSIGQRVPVNIEDEMERAYLDYAMSVIVGRALPDARDGLKPVHRRVLFAMQELGNDWNKPYKKSARVVGDVIGKYHPHGDVAVYDTIVRMAQDFSLRYLLVDGQGNFGSVDGDSPAAMRYTEVRMSRLAHEMLADLDKETVDFGPNYDGSLSEPLVLPCKFPNLLVNGSSGIAVGMATNIPPHNLGEIIDATCALIEQPELTVRDLMRFVPGPDFPTGGIIHGRGGIVSGYEEGRGSVLVRARTLIEENKDGRQAIIVSELPYQVNKARLVERIAELVREKKVMGISDLRDESNREGMRVVIELKRDAQSEVVLNQLYKHTPMQSTFGINTLALVDGQPKVLSLKDALESFLRHRREVVTRRTLFELRKAESKAHLLEGLSVALDNIDRVIALIRGSANPAEAKSVLMAEVWKREAVEEMRIRAWGEDHVPPAQFVEGGYQFSEEQAQAILEMRLHRLTSLEQDKIHDEYGETLKEIARLKGILASDAVLMGVIRGELLAIKEQFGDARRTEIRESVADFCITDLIDEEEMVVTVSHAGYIKRQPSADYRAQRRGGKGKSATGVRDEDFIEQIFAASSHDMVLCFSDKGRVFKLFVYEIPQASRTAKGKALVNLLPLEAGEKVRQILPAPDRSKAEWEKWELLFATGKGLVKKTLLSEYVNIRANGIRAIELLEDDNLIGVALLPILPGLAQEEPGAGDDEEGEGESGEEVIAEALEGAEGEEEASGEETGEESWNRAPRPGRILLFTASGKAVRFRTSQVRRTGRVARGVRGVRLRGEDRVIALTVLQPGAEVLTLTAKGYGKRTSERLFPTKGRGGMGVIGMITNARNGPVVGALTVFAEEDIMVITDQGTALRTGVETIRQTGRATQGVSVLKVSTGERVAALARLAEPEERPEDGEGEDASLDGAEPLEGDAGEEG